MDGKLACTCCRPLVGLERLSCYHRSLSSRLGTARLSPPQLVSDWTTTNPSNKKKAADGWQTVLFRLRKQQTLHLREGLQFNGRLAWTCCTPSVDLELLGCHYYGLFRLGKQQTLHLRKRLQVNGKLACTCCTPLVELELLSCHHHGFFLENNTLSTKNGCRCMNTNQKKQNLNKLKPNIEGIYAVVHCILQ